MSWKVESGLSRDDVHLDQLASFGIPQRDPPMRVATVAYPALGPSRLYRSGDIDVLHPPLLRAGGST